MILYTVKQYLNNVNNNGLLEHLNNVKVAVLNNKLTLGVNLNVWIPYRQPRGQLRPTRHPQRRLPRHPPRSHRLCQLHISQLVHHINGVRITIRQKKH